MEPNTELTAADAAIVMLRRSLLIASTDIEVVTLYYFTLVTVLLEMAIVQRPVGDHPGAHLCCQNATGHTEAVNPPSTRRFCPVI